MSRKRVKETDPLDRPTGYMRGNKDLTINEFIDWLTKDGVPDFVRPYKVDLAGSDVWRFITLQVWQLCSTGGRCYWEPLPETLQQMLATQLAQAKAKPKHPAIEPVVL